MPKVLENVRESLMEEARKQIMESGYSKMTIRSVAGACGIATGTFYNYFHSKEELAASFMIGDWLESIGEIQKACDQTKDVMRAIEIVYAGVLSFSIDHAFLFEDREAGANYRSSSPDRHRMLVGQLVKILEPFVKDQAKGYTGNLTEFIVESMLSWMREGKDPAELHKILQQFF